MTDKPPSQPPPQEDAPTALFGELEMGQSTSGYQVLARKYRPRAFSDLVGQEAMVRTLSNAFETSRIAHAFMLTGVRGVGKTTTARLLARALNYVTEAVDGPSISLDPLGEHCAAIMESRHPDVLELDAASRTGVADMRDLLDGVRYAPVSARYKIYIIDEVHMLSTAAFNALLKTLEEPPSHVKFIFATTEIRKVPVTVLSRCQRFDLKRLTPQMLAGLLSEVATKEGARVDEEGLALIARAAEGSARDGLSILDQAIVQSIDGAAVTGAAVRDMLGLADRSRLLDLFETALNGDAASAAELLETQLQDGADPLIVLKDLLEICAEVSTAKALGEAYQPDGPADWAARTRSLAEALSPAALARYWQLLLSGYKDAQGAPDIATAVLMILLRLTAAAGLPSPEDAAKILSAGGGAALPGKPEAAVGPSFRELSVGPEGGGMDTLTAFRRIVALMMERREILLASETEQFIRPVRCTADALVCDTKKGAPADLVRRIGDFLSAATDIDWSVTRSQEVTDEETLKEHRVRRKAEEIAAAGGHPMVQEAMALFPGAEIVDVWSSQNLEDESEADKVVELRKRGQQ